MRIWGLWYWIIKHQCIKWCTGDVRVGHMGLTGCEQWAGNGALTWHAAGPVHPGGWYISTGAGGRRYQADMPTPSWGHWRGSGASGCSQRGRSNAFPTADACAPASTWQNTETERWCAVVNVHVMYRHPVDFSNIGSTVKVCRISKVCEWVNESEREREMQ